MPSALTLCDHCQRHVREDEARCPFCEQPVSPAATDIATPARPARVAAIVALSLAAGLTGCFTATPVYGAPSPDVPPTDGASTADDGTPDSR